MAAEASTPSTSLSQRIDYQSLKTWIAAQEAYEAATSRPAPITPAQRKAVAELSRSNPSPLTLNIDVGDKDYISILHYYTNASQATGVSITYSDPTSTSSTAPSWTQTCTLTLTSTSPPLVFPSKKNGGLIPVDDTGRTALPSFSRKKDAKKYASKICVDYLVSNGRLVPSQDDGSLVVPSAPPPRRKGVVGSAVNPNDDDIPATQRVPALCHKLGFQAPAYQLTAVGVNGGGLWDGEADFGRDAFQFPDGIGRVEKVYGKGKAKDMIAQSVLQYLLVIEKSREEQRRKLEEY